MRVAVRLSEQRSLDRMTGRPRTIPELALARVRRDALAVMIALLRADGPVAVLALPAGLAGALACVARTPSRNCLRSLTRRARVYIPDCV